MAKAKRVVLAAVAHPDDIEFMMAGTLWRLKEAGCEVHLWNLANGSCGTAAHDRDEIVRIRRKEACDAAKLIGGTMHEPLCDDLAVFYDARLLAAAAAVVRRVDPDLVLTHSPQDYMEDHQNVCRLLVTAAFARGMRNFPTQPPAPPTGKPAAVYHALPHGLRDGLRRRVRAGQYVDIAPALSKKREMLACHRSQKEWLDKSQGMDAYLNEMEALSAEVGKQSGRFAFAEGWRRHSHLGFGPEGYDPLAEWLGPACWVDPEYEKDLG
ncbi:MAG: PIG-L family deacetylase [Planctomycetota bacterium]|nr:PIG-L family deacetylase [Planctomycetota bacterium]